MRKWITLAWIAGSLAIAGEAIAADLDFDKQFSVAEANTRSRTGAAYDRALASVMQAAEVKVALSSCLRNNPRAHSLRGYFLFTSVSRYTVVLAPQSAFSKCFAKALEDRSVPPAPGVPYLNPFAFNLAPNPTSQ